MGPAFSLSLSLHPSLSRVRRCALSFSLSLFLSLSLSLSLFLSLPLPPSLGIGGVWGPTAASTSISKSRLRSRLVEDRCRAGTCPGRRRRGPNLS